MSVNLVQNNPMLYSLEKENILTVHSNSTNTYKFYVQSKIKVSHLEEISEVVFPSKESSSSSALFSPNQLRKFSQITYPRLSVLSDGTYKLYINFRLLGGGKNLAELRRQDQVSNLELSKAIKEAVPEDTYKAINVSNVNYNFGGLGTKSSRVITLDPHNYRIASILSSIKTFFVGYKRSNAMNGTLVTGYFLGELEGDDKLDAKNEITKAFNASRKMYIYISDDWEFIEVRFGDVPGSCMVIM